MRFEKLQGLDAIRLRQLEILKGKYLTVCDGIDPVTKKRIYVDCTVGGTTYRMDAGRKAAETHDAGIRIAENNNEGYSFVIDFYNETHLGVPLADAKQIANQQALDARDHRMYYQAFKQQIAGALTVDAVKQLQDALIFPIKVLSD